MATVEGNKMSLAKAIRLIGGAGRGEAMWRSIVAPKKDPYGHTDKSRSNDSTYATPTYTMAEAQEFAKQAASYADSLRQAIHLANAQEIELDLSNI